MSLHHQYVEAILEGEKRWEFRRRTALQTGDRVWMYATAPKKAILGSFTIGEIKQLDARNPDAHIAMQGSATPLELTAYFEGIGYGFAFEVLRPNRLIEPVRLPNGAGGPQSYKMLTPTKPGDAQLLAQLKAAGGPGLAL